MLQLRGNLDLPKESRATHRSGEILAQHLHRDLTVVLLILGEIDRRHAAAADLAIDAISATKSIVQPSDYVRGHRGRQEGRTATAS
jgi:hypothetical protein